jgi:hypothetical protein
MDASEAAESSPQSEMDAGTLPTFTDQGPLPAVGETFAQGAPTASELGFGSTTPRDETVGSRRAERHESHAPAPRVADRAEPFDAKKGLEYDPRFTSMAMGTVGEDVAPKAVTLPPEVARGLDTAWQRSRKDRKEHGGNLVRTYGGKFDIRHGGRDADEGQWMPDEDDRGVGQQLLGFMHTHPYEGDAPGTFSGDDLANICDYDTRMSFVRSGPMTFMVVKTKEFDAKLQREVESEKDNRKLVEKREAFKAHLKRDFEATYKAHEGTFPEKLQAAVLVTCAKYHLIYYAGSGATLARQSARGR